MLPCRLINLSDKNEVYEDSKELLNTSENRIIEAIEKQNPLVSENKAFNLSKEGDLATLEDGIRRITRIASINHPLFPDYGYDYDHNILKSIPLTEEATTKYPPKIIFTGSIHAGNKIFDNPDDNPLDYSYRHQVPIEMHVINAEKYLGDILDPKQDDIQAFVGNSITAVPPKFPAAIPCSVIIGTETCFEYILFRVQEILDDKTIIINNKEQGGAFTFEIRFNLECPKNQKIDINLNPQHSIFERLKYVKFQSALIKCKDIHIRNLLTGRDYIAGHITIPEYKTNFTSIAEEIDFLQRMCQIEKHFGITLKPSTNICLQEYQGVVYLSDLIQKDKVHSTWGNVTFTTTINDHFRQSIREMEDKDIPFSYIGTSSVKLFNAEFDVRFYRIYPTAHIVDLEKLKRKVELMDDGETVKIKLEPGDNNTSIDSLQLPQNMQL